MDLRPDDARDDPYRSPEPTDEKSPGPNWGAIAKTIGIVAAIVVGGPIAIAILLFVVCLAIIR